MIGCDIRSMPEKTRTLLTNPSLIAISQDPECRSCYKVAVYGNADAFVLVKPLAGGEYAIGFFNFGESSYAMTLNFWDIGLSSAAGYGLRLYDCLSNQDVGIVRELLAPDIPAHGCQIYRCHAVPEA